MELIDAEDGEMDMRPDMSCAVEDIMLIEQAKGDAAVLVDFIEMLLDHAD